MAEARSRSRLAWAAVGALVLGVAAWWGLGSRAPQTRPEPDPPAATLAQPADPPPAAAPSGVAAPALRIAPAERLSLDADALPSDGPLALGLDLSDTERGNAARAVRVVSPDGRRLDTTAAPSDGSGSGVRLEIDPAWLRPGLYMIEVKTAEKTHFPLRRYVLEIRAS